MSHQAHTSDQQPVTHTRYALTLLILFLIWLIAWSSPPDDWEAWGLENILVFIAVPILVFSHRAFPLSRISYTLIFVFLCLHEIGAHYSYAKVPYNDWSEAVFGTSINDMFGLERNHFDRAIHFAYGLLLAYPIREVFVRIVSVRGFWGYFLPLDLTMSTSMIFELFEWWAAELFGGDLGIAYLGTQGDVWDAHKDMALASLGAIIAMTVTAMINVRLQRDFAQEWSDSLSVKMRRPLGEDEIARMLSEQREKTEN